MPAATKSSFVVPFIFNVDHDHRNEIADILRSFAKEKTAQAEERLTLATKENQAAALRELEIAKAQQVAVEKQTKPAAATRDTAR